MPVWGARCKGTYNHGTRCPFRVRPTDGDFCERHKNQNRGPFSKPKSVDPIRLDNIDDQSHIAVANALTKCGIFVITPNGGWPDLLVKKDGQLFGVEVKKGADILKRNQRKVLDELSSVMPCFVVRIDGVCKDHEVTWAQLLEQLNAQPQLPEYFGA